jgi:hypothetical protein
MKFTQYSPSSLAAAAIAAAALASGNAGAATDIIGELKEFTPDTATQQLQIRPDSFYNLTMGYKGWSHQSAWGYMQLKKGQPVTITAQTSVAGMHPGIAVWSVPQKDGMVPINYAYSMSYGQYESINAKNVVDDTTKAELGTMVMNFITNGFDRDGMGETLPGAYDQSLVYRILDGEAGKVSVSFTPPVTGFYKFVVGGINPAGDMAVKPGLTTFQPVSVTVKFPQ